MRRIVQEEGDADEWLIDSAGTGRYHIGSLPDCRMRVHARERDLTLDHHCRQVCESDFRDFDMIIGMDSANLQDLRDMCPDPELLPRIHAMSEWFSQPCAYDYIPDPYYEGSEGFELVLDLLEDSCQNLYNSLTHEKD